MREACAVSYRSVKSRSLRRCAWTGSSSRPTSRRGCCGWGTGACRANRPLSAEIVIEQLVAGGSMSVCKIPKNYEQTGWRRSPALAAPLYRDACDRPATFVQASAKIHRSRKMRADLRCGLVLSNGLNALADAAFENRHVGGKAKARGFRKLLEDLFHGPGLAGLDYAEVQGVGQAAAQAHDTHQVRFLPAMARLFVMVSGDRAHLRGQLPLLGEPYSSLAMIDIEQVALALQHVEGEVHRDRQ